MDCFEPIFRFLRSFWFQKNRSDTWDPKVMFSAPSGHSDITTASAKKRFSPSENKDSPKRMQIYFS